MQHRVEICHWSYMELHTWVGVEVHGKALKKVSAVKRQEFWD